MLLWGLGPPPPPFFGSYGTREAQFNFGHKKEEKKTKLLDNTEIEYIKKKLFEKCQKVTKTLFFIQKFHNF